MEKAQAVSTAAKSNINDRRSPATLDSIKQMFDSATMLKMKDKDPFKGNSLLNRTNESRWVGKKSGGGEQEKINFDERAVEAKKNLKRDDFRSINGLHVSEYKNNPIGKFPQE